MATKEVAIKKRAQIDQATKYMLIAVGAASVVLGCAIVLSIYFVKWIVFNSKVIGEKGAIIENYKSIQANVAELAVNIDELARNENLEVVARVRDSRCVDFDGNPVDTTDKIELARICSALRVIPDALPSTQNNEAVYASLNKLFLETRDAAGNVVEPSAIAPGTGSTSGLQLAPGLNAIPVALSVEETSNTTKAVLGTIERSIRNFDILTATIAWRSSSAGGVADMIELRGSAVAYYSTSMEAALRNKTIYADDEKAKTGVKR